MKLMEQREGKRGSETDPQQEQRKTIKKASSEHHRRDGRSPEKSATKRGFVKKMKKKRM
ncbi:hypothetical protein MTR_7g098880 [Medicago truncatula]|uniref:Uncharacterized protein n=1 Tax=Medicago truncatula TaxID=3880 RepID=G7KYH0_MEDTR|nr:hypothetical protein MTR_7g098880 [Medicago truncatula]